MDRDSSSTDRPSNAIGYVPAKQGAMKACMVARKLAMQQHVRPPDEQPLLCTQDENGNAAPHGSLAPELLFGPQGWCEASNPVHR